MKTKQIQHTLIYISAIGVSIFLLFFVISCSWIGYEVKSICHDAQRTYNGDCVGSLILLLNDEHRSFKEKNSAIWALGQLGDKRSLSVLKNLYTGKIPEREPLEKTISQYELKKAINLTSGGFNATAIFWRY